MGAVNEINQTVGKNAVSVLQCDVSNASVVQSCFSSVIATHGKVNILVNNAGIGHVGDVLNTAESDMDRLYAVNVKGAANCLKAAVAAMTSENATGGAIVNIASIASLIGIQDRFAYSMTKGAVLTMTYSVATDYVTRGIRCNAICPARVHTPFVDQYLAKNYAGKEAEMFKTLSQFQPIGRMGRPQEIAALALYLCSDESSFVTGAAYPIDGGVTYSRL